VPAAGPDDLARCPRCLFQRRVCLCADVPTVETRTRVVILRHVDERTRSSNSGRLAHLALPNSVILEHGERGVAFDPGEITQPGTWLVYPEGVPRTQAPAPPPARLLFLDATWSQAKKMRQKLPAMRGLPVLRLPDVAAPVQRLRESPGHGLVSTIEAIARGLRLCEGEAPAAALERLFALMIERTLATGRVMFRGP
jgi:DTW domain-containing protein YfiP